MQRRTILLGGLAAGLPLPFLARGAMAEEAWPARTVTIIAPFAPGSSSDIVARAMALPMQQRLGKPVVVENRAGATGEVGARAVARSAPDGYTLMHAPISTWAINAALRPNLGYDPVRQFTPITQTVRTPNVMVVNPKEVAANDLPGIVAWLREKRGPVAYSSSGIGSSDHLTMEMFKQRTDTEIAHVPYSGGSPAVTDLLAGTVQLSFQNLGSVQPFIVDGRLKAIFITGSERAPALANVPTAAEAGLADFVVYSWQALGAPASMPAALQGRIHYEAVAALLSPNTKGRIEEIGFQIVAGSPAEFGAFQRMEIARWKKVVEAGNIRAE